MMAMVVTRDEYGPRFLIVFLMVEKESLEHQGCLMSCVLGQYPSLHGSSKTDNRFATNESS